MTPTEMHIEALMEKNQKLEEDLDATLMSLNIVKQENARYREALEFYAESWERGDYNGDLMVRKEGSYDAFEEVHERARKALKDCLERMEFRKPMFKAALNQNSELEK